MFRLVMKKLIGFDPATILITIFLVIIAAIAIPNYVKVLNLFGYQSKAQVVEKLKIANDNVNVAVAVNKANEKTVTVLENTIKNTEKVLDIKVKEDKVVEKHTAVIKKEKDKKIAVILIQPDKSQEVKDKEVSEVQIASIWDSYCSFNTNSQCTAPPAPG